MNEQELAEYKEYLASQGFSPEEADQYISESGVQIESPSFGSRALDYGLRALDYAGGLTRTAAGEAADMFIDGDLVTGEDWKKAGVGKATSTSEMMERAGVEEGNRYNLMPEMRIPMTDITLGQGDSSARDILGFLGDVALDPLTWASLGTSAAAKKGGQTLASKVLNPVGTAMQSAGRKIYKSGMKKIDQESVKFGKEPVSDVLLKNRVTGSATKIQEQMDRIAQNLKASRDKILGKATKAGAQVDVPKSLRSAQAFVDSLRAKADPRMEATINRMQQEIDQLAETAARAEMPAQPEIRMTSLEPQLKELPVSVTQAPLDESSRVIINNEFTPAAPEVAYNATGRKVGGEMSTDVGAQYPQPLSVTQSYVTPPPTGVKPQMLDPVIDNAEDTLEILPRGGTYTQKVYRPAPYELAQEYPEIVLREATPRIPARPGPSPEQVSSWKSNTYNMIGDQGYNELKHTPVYKQFQKELARGQKEGVESAVEQSLGRGSRDSLVEMNDELGRVLTSEEKAAQAAFQEQNKNSFSAVDGILASNPKILMLKKLADAMKGSRVRTKTGLSTYDLGRSGAVDPVARQALIEYMSPWRQMQEQKK